MRSTPVADNNSVAGSNRWSLSIPTISSWFNGSSSSFFLPDCSSRGQTGSDIDDHHRYTHHRQDPTAQKMMSYSEYTRRGVALERDNEIVSVSSMFWMELKKQAEKFADTDMQLAGLI